MELTTNETIDMLNGNILGILEYELEKTEEQLAIVQSRLKTLSAVGVGSVEIEIARTGLIYWQGVKHGISRAILLFKNNSF